MSPTSVEVPALHGEAMKGMEIRLEGPQVAVLRIKAAQDLPEDYAMPCRLQLTRLQVFIVEKENNDMTELSQLHEKSKRFRLGDHPLSRLSVTYQASNQDASCNSVRFMILLNLLKQLNWELCRNTDVNLHINHVDADSTLELLRELPVNVFVSGNSGDTKQDAVNDKIQLKMLERSYLYLSGYL